MSACTVSVSMTWWFRQDMPCWAGGATAYHQHHPSENPPVGHLHDIVRNAHIFRRSWGRWPMVGWLEEFARRGLVRFDGDTLEELRVTQPGAAATCSSPH